MKPSAKGVSADIKHLPKLAAAFRKAEVTARELKLIENDVEGDQ